MYYEIIELTKNNKLDIVKAVKNATNLGHKDSKDHVDAGTTFLVPPENEKFFEKEIIGLGLVVNRSIPPVEVVG